MNNAGGMNGQGWRYDFEALCLLPDRLLEQLMRRGSQPSLESLSGSEFDGFNTATLAFAIRKFRKGFYSDPGLPAGEVGGYNVSIRQGGGLRSSWEVVIKGGKPHRHSFFRVYPVRPGEADNLYPNAVLLNYHSPRTPWWNPASRLRDYLVQVYPDDQDLLLGKAYVALPYGKRLFVSFFVLRRVKGS